MEVGENFITFEVEYKGEGIIRQLLLGVKHDPWYKLILKAPYNILVIFIACLILIFAFGWLNVWSALLAFVFAIVLRAFFIPYLIERLSELIVFYERKVKSESGFVAPTHKVKFLFNDIGVTIESESMNQVTVWDKVTGAAESERDIVLYYSDPLPYLFPKKIFQTFDELYFFKEFISHNIGARAAF